MEDWKEYRLDELYVFGNGLSKGSKYFGYGHPFVSFKTVFNNYFLPEELSDYVDSDEKEQTKCSVQKSDVLLTRTSETVNELGYSCVALRDYPKATFNGFCKRMRPITEGIIHDLYAGYYFRSSHFRNQVCSMSNMVTRASLSNEMLGRLTIKLPSYKTQTQIGELLFSIDRKIALNRQINDNLEQQAQALYKSWFIDFEPFKDGDFVESELGLIPEGWKVVELGEVTKQITEKVKNRTDVKVLSPVTTGELVLSEEYFTKQVFSESIAKYITVKPLQFAYNPARVNIGSLGMNTFEFDGCVSPVYVVFECERDYQYFFDYFRKTEAFKEEVLTRAIGGVRQSLSYKDFSLIKLIYPPRTIVEKFNRLYSNILVSINHNKVEANNLTDMRDTLLPKLMSGELKINEIDC